MLDVKGIKYDLNILDKINDGNEHECEIDIVDGKLFAIKKVSKDVDTYDDYEQLIHNLTIESQLNRK